MPESRNRLKKEEFIMFTALTLTVICACAAAFSYHVNRVMH